MNPSMMMMKKSLVFCGVALLVAVCLVSRCSAQPSSQVASESGELASVSPADLTPAAGHHYGKSHDSGHGKYYMYAEVPKKGAYKMGFRRGNEKHTIERKESVHGTHVESYFKWADKKGKGSHKFELKHGDSKHHHY